MIEFLTPESIDDLADSYYKGRWCYLKEAARLCRAIPGWQKFHPRDVLEIGPYRLPLINDCHVLDNHDHGIARTYPHNATEVPWPVGRHWYRLLVALQVWEHLQGRQREVWAEARQVADWAVISVPHLWPASTGEDHANISLDTLRNWTGQVPIASVIVPSHVKDRSRIVCLYDLNAEQTAD